MDEILPGIWHWTRVHPRIHKAVSSYFLTAEGILIDPLLPEGGADALPGKPLHVLLTNRHHYRDSGAFAKRFGCEVHCSEAGMHEFDRGEAVTPFRYGDELPGGIVAVEIGALCTDETALHIARHGAVALADGVVREGDGPLATVPAPLLGDDPEAVVQGLRASYRRLLERDFDHLLLAHGTPVIGGGKQALAEFVAG